MSNSKFTAFDLDQLINDCTGQVDQVSQQLSTYKDQQVIPCGNPQTKDLIDTTGLSVDFSRVYNQLEKLIQNGNAALQVLAAIDPDTIQPGTLTATATLMSAIKNCLSEFTRIHSIHIKHQLALDMEAVRQKNRIQLMQVKQNLKEKKTEDIQTAELSEFSDKTTADIFRYLRQQKEKRENSI